MAKRKLVDDKGPVIGGRKQGDPPVEPAPVQDRGTVDAEVQAAINGPVHRADTINEGDFDRGVLSTGSTLLDCAISSERVYGGGVPAGVILEIYGPSSSGKTAILAELAASAKFKGGAARFDDPEGRLDTKYAQQCGLTLTKKEYGRPDTVEDLFEGLEAWTPKGKKGTLHVSCEDSIAAFSTRAEMADPNMEYAAAKRAQKYHQGFRTLGRRIAQEGWIIACSNHELVNFETGAKSTPGGNALKYWASIRLRIAKAYRQGDIKRTWKISSATVERIIGIRSDVKVVKNSCGQPFREAPVFIIFGKGIDDVRGNLWWLKTTLGTDKYDCVDKEYSDIYAAIKYVEDNNLEAQLRDKVIKLWNTIDLHFTDDRKPKVRF
jgi:RecA/RadA recombinase